MGMQLSLSEACHLLGKTPRQLRYMIKLGRLAATRVGERWFIDRDALTLSDGASRARERKAGELRDAVEHALGPHLASDGKRRLSVRDLPAFAIGEPLHRLVQQLLGAAHPASQALSEALVSIAQGHHRFHGGEKLDAYRVAREQAARAVALLLTTDDDRIRAASATLEQEFFPALVGLIRRSERRTQS